MTPHYGFDCDGVPWYGDADDIHEAMRIAQRETGRPVMRGRCLDHYTDPRPGEYVDTRAFLAMQRDLERRAELARGER